MIVLPRCCPRKCRCQEGKSRAEILNQNQRVVGAPEEIRTPDPQIRSLVLYPAELRALDSAAGNRPAGRGIAIVLTAYWQELRRELSRRLRGPGLSLIFDADSIGE